ncbi:MAG TPA: 50S ribosomal protein L11 methyltransferase [Candidatus Limiplasma sp.]|nr:50S ribosomal protein L11 methyltransferase [Candidatus Limiplasma sp.]
MQWIEAVVHTTTAGSDLVSDLLVRNGALGTQVMDRKDVDEIKRGESAWELFDEKLISEMPRDVLVKGWFSQEDQKKLDTLDAQLGTLREKSPGIDMGLLTTDVSAVADDDWAESWKRYYKPFRVGNRLIVKPSWEPFKPAGKDLIIEIDPGMAFGTGTHETTNMCMMLLETYLEQDMRVMDVGTGSGILAIAAAKLGAAQVLGIDVDADAVKVAQENIRRNGVESIVTAVKGDMVRGEAIDCDLVVANLVTGAIAILAEPVKRYLRVGGYFVASGIIREREKDALDAITQAGFVILERLEQGDWVGLCARRME